MKASRYNHILEVDGKRYLFNSFTRGLHEVEDYVVDSLERLFEMDGNWARALPAEIVDTLKANGYVVDDAADERALILSQRGDMQRDKSVLSLTIAPTLDCNFGCPYCFEGQAKPKLRMPQTTMRAMIEFIKGLATEDTKDLFVTWFGGEPLLALPQITEITQLLKSELLEPQAISYDASIITNGYGLTGKVAARLRDLGITLAQVTLDGTAPFHDARRFLRVNHGGTFNQILVGRRPPRAVAFVEPRRCRPFRVGALTKPA